MATITQQPAALSLVGVINNPFSLVVNFTSITNAAGASVAWSSITNPTVVITDQYGNAIAGSSASVSSPANFEYLISFTAAQTTLISNAQSARWALEITVLGTGPTSVLGGAITFVPPSYPASSTSTTANLAVAVGTNSANLSIALGGYMIANIDGGNAYAD